MLHAECRRHQLSSGCKNRSDFFLFCNSQSRYTVLPAKQTADVHHIGNNLLYDFSELPHLIVLQIVYITSEYGVLPFMNPIIFGPIGIISDCYHRNIHKFGSKLCHICHADSGTASFLRWIKTMRKQQQPHL